jgi:hypothetical protein
METFAPGASRGRGLMMTAHLALVPTLVGHYFAAQPAPCRADVTNGKLCLAFTAAQHAAGKHMVLGLLASATLGQQCSHLRIGEPWGSPHLWAIRNAEELHAMKEKQLCERFLSERKTLCTIPGFTAARRKPEQTKHLVKGAGQ